MNFYVMIVLAVCIGIVAGTLADYVYPNTVLRCELARKGKG